MKTFLTTLSLFLLVSCGAKQQVHKELSIHPEAQAYVTEFESRQGMTITDLKVTFAKDSNPNRLGYCSRQRIVKRKTTASGVVDHIYETPLIVLNTDYWNDPNFSTARKEQVVFHELGHCILNRDHTTAPNSLMYTYALSEQMYLSNYAAYMTEFFKSNTSTARVSNFNPDSYALMVEEVETEELTHPEGDECVHDHGEVVVQESAE